MSQGMSEALEKQMTTKGTIQNFFDSTGQHPAMNIEEVDGILDFVGDATGLSRASTPDEAVEYYRKLSGERIDAKSQREALITKWGTRV